MKTVSVEEMMANWSEIERQVGQGETFEVLNCGKPIVRIVPANPQYPVKWENHLTTALRAGNGTGEGAVYENRERRW